MHAFGSLTSDYYVNMNLNTEMKLPDNRETILGLFERVQKSFPSMQNFYTRENGHFVLEEEKEGGCQRWISVESQRICSGFINPPEPDDAFAQHELVLQLIPYMLSVNSLDCDALDYIIGFDFSYAGNHDALIAEALGTGNALEGVREIPGAQVLNFEPSITIGLDDACRMQARILIETRTTPYQVRRHEYGDEQISVFFTVRRYGSLEPETTFEQTFLQLKEKSDELLKSYVVEQVLRPLAQAIAAK